MPHSGHARSAEQFDPRFKLFHELMSRKVREVLLISTPYDAWVMEEDCRLSEAIINEYRGLNLSHPPRLNWISTADAALEAIESLDLDLVIIMPSASDRSFLATAEMIRARAPKLPIMLLCHQLDPAYGGACLPEYSQSRLFDRVYIWRGNSDLLLAMIKSVEDQKNAPHDAGFASIRVIIVVEDSPEYLSVLLPLFYRVLVLQTQAVMEEGLNEEHRLLAMRARPKILVAGTFEDAMKLYRQFEPYVFAIISDVRFPRRNRFDENAGIDLLKTIKSERFDIPMLLMSTEAKNAAKAAEIPALFVDKNSPTLLSEVRSFFLHHLGFGDFVFRWPDNSEISRAPNLRALEKMLSTIPDESFAHHCNHNDFSRWLFARSEIELASRVRPIREADFANLETHRRFLISTIHQRRMQRQRGVVVDFDPKAFDEDSEFMKIGTGSLGGKARGLSFVSALLRRYPPIEDKLAPVNVFIPQTLVITTEVFDAFVQRNSLLELAKADLPDERIAARFLEGRFPQEYEDLLAGFLQHFAYPLAVRSSSLLEDAQFRAYAGLYKTYMLANDHGDLGCRLSQLITAVKLVYASTYFQGPKSYAKRVGHRTEEEKMAVIVQRVVGERHSDFFYPAIAGTAQSHNYYPYSRMKPEDGIATIALGLGKAVMEGERALRFCPRYPDLLQHSAVDDILKNSQRFFYSLRLGDLTCQLSPDDSLNLVRREIVDAREEDPIKLLSSSYMPDEHCLRDSQSPQGYPVVTFAQVLKYRIFPLPEILDAVLAIGQEGMGCPVELEFAVTADYPGTHAADFAILQLRPMSARAEMVDIDITARDLERAFCISSQALGNRISTDITDIVFVKPGSFDPVHMPEIAGHIGQINASLLSEERKYVLIGPGRWGSADRWLGIPVTWADISGVTAMVETAHPKLSAEPSQGSHFFHNLISLGINYLTVDGVKGSIDWDWLTSQAPRRETRYVAHLSLDRPLTLKVDGRTSRGVILYDAQETS
ncbi:MAG: phosphoenolpyruvate synthase/pyruvate phosphate dikinase [Desulfobacteraceae bacterium]|nr:phosphoenolpyruvate synthase/pyruvate phosphate dikinase [Desulfobacteraceae bacterium]